MGRRLAPLDLTAIDGLAGLAAFGQSRLAATVTAPPIIRAAIPNHLDLRIVGEHFLQALEGLLTPASHNHPWHELYISWPPARIHDRRGTTSSC